MITTGTTHTDPVLAAKAETLRQQVAGMEAKARRLALAISERRQALSRLSASAALGATLPAHRRHE